MRGVVLSIVVVTLVSGIACKSGSDTPTSPTPSSPGTITMTSTSINNQGGKVLVIAAIPEGTTNPVGRACVPITSNAFVLSATLLVELAASANPCDPASTTRTFAAGRYSVTSGIFVGTSTTPERLTSQTVQVSGNVTASINGTLLSQ
jgi:hypothetical protein